MPVHDDLGKRMKEFYEQIPKTKLVRRMPVAIRIDGKSFHNFTKGFNRPFDDILIKTMTDTTRYLCENIQGCVFGYTQSDEITLILIDYQNLNSSAWFDYEVQKICSISASMATMTFNKYFAVNVKDWQKATFNDWRPIDNPNCAVSDAYQRAINTGAMFDARCFNIPKEEVCNLIYWRQLDATRNSIQMVGQANFSHKELQGKSCNDIQDMLMTQKGINWNDYPTYKKRGTACYKKTAEAAVISSFNIDHPNDEPIYRTFWSIDKDMPILKNEDRKYVEKYIFLGQDS